MAKRNKKIITSRRPKMKIESLESRQLLASDIAGAVEVNSDIFVQFNGNTFDQLLMNGSSASFRNDPGQITRLALQDIDADGNRGEIIQIEASGAGIFNVSLTGFLPAAAPSGNYNQPDVDYVAGKATVTIHQSDETSNLGIYALGPATDFTPGGADQNMLFLDPVTELPFAADYAQADLQAVIVVNDPNGEGDLFGNMRLGNVQFSGDSGIVGISAPGTNVIGPNVMVGGLNASDAANPTFTFAPGAQFGTLNIVGGAIVNTSINGLTVGGGYDVNFIDGIEADGDPLRATVDPGATGFGGAGVANLTLADDELVDITGWSQQNITDYFEGRTFTNDLTIDGPLSEFFNFEADAFRGDLIFNDLIEGSVEVLDGGIGGDLVFEKGIEGTGDIELNGGNVAGLTRFGSAGVGNGADLGVDLAGGVFGDIQIWGNQNGEIDAGAIGDITIKGNATKSITGTNGIGNTLVEGDVTVTGTFLYTDSDGKGDTAFGHIGNTIVNGDVNVTEFLHVDNLGRFGDVTILGGTGGDQDVGGFMADGQLGTDKTTGAISITAGGDLVIDGVNIDTAEGTAGGVTVTGAGAAADTFTSTGIFDGSLTVSGFDDFTIGGTLNGDSSFTGSALEESSATLNADAGDDVAVTITGVEDLTQGVGSDLGGTLSFTSGGDTDDNAAATLNGIVDKAVTIDGVDTFNASSTSDLNAAATVTLNTGGMLSLEGIVNGLFTSTGAATVTIGDDAAGFEATLDGGVNITLDGSDKSSVLIEGDTGKADTVLDGGTTITGFNTFSTSSDAVTIDGDLTLTSIAGDADAKTDLLPSTILFADGFESGDTTAWSITSSGDGSSVTTNGVTTEGFTSSSLNISSNTINLNGLIAATKSLGNVNLTGTVETATDGGFSAVDANDVTITGDLNHDSGATFLTLTDGALNSFTVTGDSDLDNDLLNLTDGNNDNNNDVGALSFGGVDIAAATSLIATADTVASLNTTGDFVVAATGGVIDLFTSLGNSKIGGDLTLPDAARIAPTGTLGDFEVTGTATLINAGGGASLFADSIGDLTFGSLVTTLSTGTSISVNDGTSTIDTIGDVTINGQVVGVNGVTEIQASAIGDITVAGALTSNDTLVTDFNVLATPNGLAGGGAKNDDVINGLIEQVNQNGSDIGNYSIGDISISSNISASNPTPTFIFGGDNTFAALGNLGTVNIVGGISANNSQQSALFSAATDGAWFSAGDGDGSLVDGDDDLGVGAEGIFGLEGDTTDTSVVLAVTDPTYTAGTVGVGNVTVNALQTDQTIGVSETDNIAGAVASSATVEGLAVLSSVTTVDGDVFVYDIGGNLTVNYAAIAGLGGTVGDVTVNSGFADGFVDAVADVTTIDGDANDEVSGIVAATSVGTFFGTNIDLDASLEAVIIGDDGVAPADDDTVEAGLGSNQLVVAVV